MIEPAFYEVIEKHYDQVKRFIAFTVKDQWIADDLCQETFIKAQNKIDSLSDQTKIKSWLLRIAHNCCIDYLRSQPNKTLTLFDPDNCKTVQKTITPLKELEISEMNRCVQQKMLMLPHHYRSILWLADAGELSYTEIAIILDISKSNVKARLHRARKKFKEILNNHCNFSVDERAVVVCTPK